MNIAIITARGGSKRIPRKNIKEFCGKPIIYYSIKAALDSGIFDTVMVSTDDDEITRIARNYGAEVPFKRSQETADDFATTSDVLQEVIESYRRQGKNFDRFCCIYPTCPLLKKERLQEAMIMLDDCNGVKPVVKFSFPPQRSLIINDGFLEYQYPEFTNSRSQDLEAVYHDSGQFYAMRTEAFLTAGTLNVTNLKPIILNEMEVQDIDTDDDWKLAELKYKYIMM
ncbi:MAG: pseudaminic acid cytidylyltransferase [Lachnospiraceae bacterium]|nr:pseudaminic acid cytidylyltransferase [Lachnospiraceae bacterium]